MNRYRIAGWECYYEKDLKGEWVHFEDAEAAIKAAVKAERKAICLLIDNYFKQDVYKSADSIISAIRAREEK